jgi:protein ImuB
MRTYVRYGPHRACAVAGSVIATPIMVICVHMPRFALTVAAGGPAALAGSALAVAPIPGGQARVGEVSGAAEGFGVCAGMSLGEALARCPELRLVPGDPLGVQEVWERIARALEGIGAALELPCAGLVYFEADGLFGLYGGEGGLIAATRQALGRPARIGAGPTRFGALAAALEPRARRTLVLREGAHARGQLAAQPIALLGHRADTAALVTPLRRLGVRTLGELAAIGAAALADRFGQPGVLAWRLARGEDTPLRPQPLAERLQEAFELWESSNGPTLERVLGALVDRLLARSALRGRTLRVLTLSARLVAGGTWSERVVLREALCDPRRLRLALSPHLVSLPAPAVSLRLVAERFGPPASAQGELAFGCAAGPQGARARPAADARRARLREAVAQARAAAGPEAALRVLCVDPDSRVPERRAVLTPFVP